MLTMLGVQRERPSLYDLVDDLRALTVPTLLMAGDEDTGCLRTNLMLKEAIPAAGLWVLPRTGHTTNLEEPDLFNRFVDKFTAVEAGAWGLRDPRSVSEPDRHLRVSAASWPIPLRPALTHEAALRVLRAGIEKAEAMGTPQCIAVVDPAGHLLAFVRMDGAKFLSIRTAQRKARTAAKSSHRQRAGSSRPTRSSSRSCRGGNVTNLKGGLPIEVDGHVVGAVGVQAGDAASSRTSRWRRRQSRR